MSRVNRTVNNGKWFLKKKEKIRNVNTGSHYTELFKKTEYYLDIVMMIIDTAIQPVDIISIFDYLD